MSWIKSVENFIIDRELFSKGQENLRYKYLLLSSMIIAATLATFVASIARYLHGYHFIATMDLSISLILFFLHRNLKKTKKSYEKIATVGLGLFFILFTVVLFNTGNKVAFLWFSALIVSSYVLKGVRGGFISFVSIVAIATFAKLFYPQALDVTYEDLAIVFVSYAGISLYLNFSEMEHARSINDLKIGAKKIAKMQQKLYEQSRVEPTTKLPNKFALIQDIKEQEGDISLVFMEIDDYYLYANEFGEGFMQHSYKRIGSILESKRDKNCKLYFIRDGRFVFLITNPLKDQDIKLANRVRDIFKQRSLKGGEFLLHITFSIAIVREKENALAHADMTLRKLKDMSGDIVTLYKHDDKLEEIQKNNIYWSKRLPELIDKDRVFPYYQAIVDNSNREIVKYEALVRAEDYGKIVPPFKFLPAAKSRGLYKDITRIVIDKSFKEFASNSLDLSINITEDDLRDGYLSGYLMEKSKQYDIEPNRVYLEVLENINSEASNYADDEFRKIRDLGFRLAIDDFGAESSNFSRLMTLKADIIKIDGQFVKNLDRDENSHKIIEAIVSLAKNLEAKTVAEFVHNEEIFKIVKDLGVDFSQGYYFSAPMPTIFQKEQELALI